MSTSADGIGGPVIPMAQEGAAGPLIAHGPGPGSHLQRRDSPAEAAPTLLRPTGVTDQSPGPVTLDIVNLSERTLYTKDIRPLPPEDPEDDQSSNRPQFSRLLGYPLDAASVLLFWLGQTSA
jgi:hypothetical protein